MWTFFVVCYGCIWQDIWWKKQTLERLGCFSGISEKGQNPNLRRFAGSERPIVPRPHRVNSGIKKGLQTRVPARFHRFTVSAVKDIADEECGICSQDSYQEIKKDIWKRLQRKEIYMRHSLEGASNVVADAQNWWGTNTSAPTKLLQEISSETTSLAWKHESCLTEL